MTKSKYAAFVARAVEAGAVEAKIIDTSTIVTGAWVRMKCKFGCSGYDSSLCCPPHTPGPDETRKVIDCYRKAILIHCDDTRKVTKLVVKLEREVFLAGFHKAFGFGAGPCTICRQCTGDVCKYPERARPSMEACGIDVFGTARGNGYPIDVVADYDDDDNYYGLVLIE